MYDALHCTHFNFSNQQCGGDDVNDALNELAGSLNEAATTPLNGAIGKDASAVEIGDVGAGGAGGAGTIPPEKTGITLLGKSVDAATQVDFDSMEDLENEASCILGESL